MSTTTMQTTEYATTEKATEKATEKPSEASKTEAVTPVTPATAATQPTPAYPPIGPYGYPNVPNQVWSAAGNPQLPGYNSGFGGQYGMQLPGQPGRPVAQPGQPAPVQPSGQFQMQYQRPFQPGPYQQPTYTNGGFSIPQGQGQTVINFSPVMNNNMDDISVGADSQSSASHGDGGLTDTETRTETFDSHRPEGFKKDEKHSEFGPQVAEEVQLKNASDDSGQDNIYLTQYARRAIFDTSTMLTAITDEHIKIISKRLQIPLFFYFRKYL